MIDKQRDICQAILAIVSLILCSQPLHAESNSEAISLCTKQMNAYFESEASRLRYEAWQRIDSREKLDAARDRLHKEFLYMIGLDPLPPRTDLKVQLVRTVQREGYAVDVLQFQSMPNLYVTANLYRPTSGEGPFPAVLLGPGHRSSPYGGKSVRQNYAFPWIQNGYLCLVIDPMQVAEVFGVHRGTHAWGHMDWYARGYTPIGIEVWNAMRGLDYLLSRTDVDGDKITINGCSGGGHLSWMAGVADPRIQVVQPVAGASDIYGHITNNLQALHCDCGYFINLYRHDWSTLTALICPRPLLIHATTEDSYYPPVGYLPLVEKAREVASWYGKERKTGLVEEPGGHGYSPTQKEKAVEFSNRWLRGITTKVQVKPFVEIPHDQLAAMGGRRGSHPFNINDRVQDLLIPTAELEWYDSLLDWEKKKNEILYNLKHFVFRNMPSQISDPGTSARGSGDYTIETEQGIHVDMVSYAPKSDDSKHPIALYIASEGDTNNSGLWGMMKAYPFNSDKVTRHVVYPRGIGTNIWNADVTKRYKRQSMLLGRTLEDMQLYDVLCAIDHLANQPSFDGKEITLVGKGPMGIIGAYAALLDSRVTRVILHSPELTHRSAPVFLNVLRYTDIPQVLAMLAPRCELVFLTHEIEQFEYTKGIYDLQAVGHKFRRCTTIAEALNTLENLSDPEQ